MLTADEFAEWEAFHELEPFGPRAEALQQAITASTIANAFRGKDSEAFTPSQFTIGDRDELDPRPADDGTTMLRDLFARASEQEGY